MHEPSGLYPLPPLSVNGNIESFPHYLIRLAKAHLVSPRDLIFIFLFGFIRKNIKKVNNQIIFTIGSFCALTLDLIDLLQRLVVRDDLMATTLLPFRHIISNANLLRDHNAWCPKCYENPETRYDTQLSMLEVIEICPFHGIPLVENCPYPDCQKTFPTLTLYRVPGYCPHCQRFLGDQPLYEDQKHNIDIEHQQWIAKNLIELMANWDKAETYSKDHIFSATEYYINKFTNRSRTEFCRRTAINISYYQGSKQDNRYINLTVLLAFAHELDVTLVQLFSGEALDILVSRSVEALALYDRKRAGWIDPVFLQQELQKFLDMDQITPLDEIAVILGVSLESMRTHCPEKCEAIKVKNARLRTFDKSKIKQFLNELIDSPTTPHSIETIAIQLSCSPEFLRQNFKEECRAIKKRRQQDPSIKYHRPRKKPDEIRAEFVDILRENPDCTIPLYKIAKQIGCTEKTLKQACPDFSQKVLDRIAQKEADEREGLRIRLEDFAQQNPPLSLTVVAVVLNVDEPKLRKLLPEICDRITKRYQALDLEKMAQVLEVALSAEPPQSLESVAREVGYVSDTLRHYFPERSAQIMNRYHSFFKIDPVKLQEQLMGFLAEEFWPPIHLEEVARILGYRSATLREHLPNACADIVKRVRNYEKSRRNAWIEKIKADVFHTTVRLKKLGKYPSRGKVASNLLSSFAKVILIPKITEYHKQIIKDLGYAE